MANVAGYCIINVSFRAIRGASAIGTPTGYSQYGEHSRDCPQAGERDLSEALGMSFLRPYNSHLKHDCTQGWLESDRNVRPTHPVA